MNYEVGGDPAQLHALADVQQQYRQRFESSMTEIQALAQATLMQWEGAGTDGFHRRATEFNAHFESTMNAFGQLISATSSAAANYEQLGRRITNRFV